jgi:hypothetical protein
MAFLAQRPQIITGAIFRRMVKARYCQNYFFALPDNAIFHAAKFTLVFTFHKYFSAYLAPAMRIPFFIFWQYRHV